VERIELVDITVERNLDKLFSDVHERITVDMEVGGK